MVAFACSSCPYQYRVQNRFEQRTEGRTVEIVGVQSEKIQGQLDLTSALCPPPPDPDPPFSSFFLLFFPFSFASPLLCFVLILTRSVLSRVPARGRVLLRAADAVGGRGGHHLLHVPEVLAPLARAVGRALHSTARRRWEARHDSAARLGAF